MGKNYSEYVLTRLSTYPYPLQRRKKVLLNNQEKRQEKRKIICITKTLTFSLDLDTKDVTQSKESFT